MSIGNGPPEQAPEQTLEQRVEWLEQRFKDAEKQVSDLGTLYHSLVRDTEIALQRVMNLENKTTHFSPEVENCPKCHRKVNKGARSCQICGNAW